MKSLLRNILFSFLLLVIGHYTAFSQTKITEKFDNKSLQEVLEMISKNYKVKLAYDNSLVSYIIVSGSFRNELIDDVLKELLKTTKLEFLKINEVYIIKPRIGDPVVTPKPETPKPVQYKIIGVIKEKETGESLPYASISVQETKKGTSANTDGYFSISSEKEDSITLRVNYLGFKPVEMKVAPLLKNQVITVELSRNNSLITNVVVVQNQPELVASDYNPGVFQWNSRNNSNPPSISNIDIAAPLQLLPGIDGTTESLSGLVVRHSPSDKNLFVYDGFTIYHIDHFFGAFTSFNSKAIKDIRITRGGFDSQWGGRVSSVVEITGKTGNENKFIADVGTDQLSADIELEGPIGKKTTFVFASRRSYTDWYHSNLYYNLFESARSDLLLSNQTPTAFKTDPSQPGFYFYDLNTKVSFKPSPNDVISISGYKGYDDLKLNDTESVPNVFEDSNWGNSGAGVRWSRQWGSKFYHNLTIGASRYNMYYNHLDLKLRKRQGNSGIVDTISHTYLTDNQLDDINVNFLGELKLGSKNTLEFGLTGNNVDINSLNGYSNYSFGNKIIDTLRIYDNKVSNYTVWAQNTISFGSLKAFKFGGRATYNDLTKKYYFEPRAQLVVQSTDNFTLKMASGLYYQFVNRILAYTNGSYKNTWKISDGKQFPVVKSFHYVGGFVWKFPYGISLDFEGYFKQTSGISFEQTVIRRTATTKVVQEQRILLMNNKTFGGDFLLKKNWKKGQSWISYSLSRSLNQCDNLNGGEDYLALDDHLSELKIVNVFDVRKWNFTVVWIYGSGKPWDEILLTSTLVPSPDYEKNAAQLSSYHRMDIGVSYTFRVKNGDFKLGAKVFNLYNKVNILSKPFQLSENPIQDYLQGISPIVYKELPGMGFTPSFFVNLRF
ncbi:MAG: carboxypeptidase-like regulatory domain-containing protein [Tenuifilaceae bacterium]